MEKGQYFIFIVFVVTMLHSACEQSEICQNEAATYANVGFYISINGVLIDTTFEKFAFRGLQIPDTIPFDTLSNKKSVLLPLPQGSDSCRFIFSIAVYDSILIDVNDTVQKKIWGINYFVDDTFHLSFTRQIYLISADCGFSYYFDLKSLAHTNNIIKTAEIVNSEIDPLNAENIKIRF